MSRYFLKPLLCDTTKNSITDKPNSRHELNPTKQKQYFKEGIRWPELF